MYWIIIYICQNAVASIEAEISTKNPNYKNMFDDPLI